MDTQLTLILFHSTCYLLFLFLLWRAKEKKGLRLFDENGLATNLPILIELQVAGIVLFGILPFVFEHPGSFIFFNGIDVTNLSSWITILFVLVSLMITPLILGKNLRAFPGMINASSSPGTAYYVTYFVIRIIFIIAYESWFRGFLLTDSIVSFGVVWAILSNVFLYALLHVVNGKDEVIACFPYGLLLCGLCVWQGAVWPAVVIHLALTVPYELGFVRKLKLIIAYPV
ncbi:MAG: CPBP family intramembrane glutamic endopeptidase [Saprospiraceae bacterium]